MAALVLLLTSACQSAERPAGSGPTTRPTGLTEADVRSRCLSAIPDDAPIRAVTTLEGPSIALPAVDIGPATSSDTAMVLLPQVNAGLCGWGRFATYAAGRGVSSVLIDVCGYGQSECSEPAGEDIAGQVDLAAEHLRERVATRVVVVGVSMGGSDAVLATAGGAEVDGWADISGPPTWDRVRLLDLAGRIDEPGLVGYARSDGALAYRAAQRLARRSDAEFVDGGHGHGWELLTTHVGRPRPLAERLLAFVARVR